MDDLQRSDTTLDRLIAGLHEREMKMLLDIVCNHSSPDACWSQKGVDALRIDTVKHMPLWFTSTASAATTATRAASWR